MYFNLCSYITCKVWSVLDIKINCTNTVVGKLSCLGCIPTPHVLQMSFQMVENFGYDAAVGDSYGF